MKDYMDATVQWKWRSYFTKANLDLGQSDMNNNKLEGFECDPNGAWAKARTIGGFDVEVKRAPTSFEEALSYPSWNTLTSYSYGYQPSASSRYYSCSCSSGKNGQRCRHLASLLLKWEKEHGPFVFTEDEEAHAKRIETIRQRQALEQRQKQLEQEKKQKQANVFPVLDYVLDRYGHAPKGLFFPIDNSLKKAELYTDAYETGLLQTLLSPERVGDVNVETLYGETRSQVLRISGTFAAAPVTIRADRSSIIELSCGCSRAHLRFSGYYWRSTDNYRSRMCAHALAAWVLARQKIIRDNPGDETDYKGSRFLALISGENRPGPAADSAKDVPVYEKQPRVVLTPRITRDKARGKMTLNFDIGRTGERCYAVKGLKGLVEAVEGDQTYGLSKASSLDFSRETFTPDSARWYALALSRVRAIGSVNARIHSYAYGSGTPSAEKHSGETNATRSPSTERISSCVGRRLVPPAGAAAPARWREGHAPPFSMGFSHRGVRSRIQSSSGVFMRASLAESAAGDKARRASGRLGGEGRADEQEQVRGVGREEKRARSAREAAVGAAAARPAEDEQQQRHGQRDGQVAGEDRRVDAGHRADGAGEADDRPDQPRNGRPGPLDSPYEEREEPGPSDNAEETRLDDDSTHGVPFFAPSADSACASDSVSSADSA